MKWCVIPVKILDHRPTVLWCQKPVHSLYQLTFFLPLSFYASFFFYLLFLPLSLLFPHFFLLFCTVWFAQHESSCKLICTANQIWVSICQILGFIPATIELWCSAVEFLIVIGRHSAFLPAAALMYDALRFLLLQSSSFFLSLLQLPHSLWASFFKAFMLRISYFLIVDNCVTDTVCQCFDSMNFSLSSSLVPQDAGSQQIGFLLGSCGVTLALTTDACQKGLPKAQTGEVATFKGTACFAFILSVCLCRFIWFELISRLLSLQAGRGCCGLWQMENMLWSLQKTGILQYGKLVMT